MVKIHKVHIDDLRSPGGSAEELLKNYKLVKIPHENGTFDVRGEFKNILFYLEDYNIHTEEGDIIEDKASQ